MPEMFNETNGIVTIDWLVFLVRVNQQIAWRFISSSVMISPFILLILSLRGKFSPRLRSRLLGACFMGLILPFQRSAFYFFDGLFPVVRRIAQRFYISFDGKIRFDFFAVASVIWFAGFAFCLIYQYRDYRKTIRLLREGKCESCVSYFHRFKSRIYLPPEIERTYAPHEKEMLLTHERRHIAQRDPLIYRILAVIECACWFNPLVSVAVRHFKHERELLCDESVAQSYSKYDYGMLILKIARSKPAARAETAGMVMEFGSISERVTSLLKPAKTVGKWAAACVILLAAAQFAIGFLGFRPSWMGAGDFTPESLKKLGLAEVSVFEMKDNNFDKGWKPLKELVPFVLVTKNSIALDQQGMYDRAISLGLTDESCILITNVDGIRPEWGEGAISNRFMGFELKNLKAEDCTARYRDNKDLYTILTDILI